MTNVCSSLIAVGVWKQTAIRLAVRVSLQSAINQVVKNAFLHMSILFPQTVNQVFHIWESGASLLF